MILRAVSREVLYFCAPLSFFATLFCHVYLSAEIAGLEPARPISASTAFQAGPFTNRGISPYYILPSLVAAASVAHAILTVVARRLDRTASYIGSSLSSTPKSPPASEAKWGYCLDRFLAKLSNAPLSVDPEPSTDPS